MGSAKKSLISRYRCAVDRQIKLVNMEPSELAGYYLLRFPGDPISAITDDMLEYNVSSVKGNAALVLIKAVNKNTEE